jgi:hypothetical protein
MTDNNVDIEDQMNNVEHHQHNSFRPVSILDTGGLDLNENDFNDYHAGGLRATMMNGN